MLDFQIKLQFGLMDLICGLFIVSLGTSFFPRSYVYLVLCLLEFPALVWGYSIIQTFKIESNIFRILVHIYTFFALVSFPLLFVQTIVGLSQIVLDGDWGWPIPIKRPLLFWGITACAGVLVSSMMYLENYRAKHKSKESQVQKVNYLRVLLYIIMAGLIFALMSHLMNF